MRLGGSSTSLGGCSKIVLMCREKATEIFDVSQRGGGEKMNRVVKEGVKFFTVKFPC